jgi:peptide/nickel transport system permease protein
MKKYFYQRLCIIPLTIFCILIVNFIIINLVEDPSAYKESVSNEEYFLNHSKPSYKTAFNEHYGLNLPIFFNKSAFKGESKQERFFGEKLLLMFTHTRFIRYFGRLMQFDFGMTRYDMSKKVTTEVLSRLKVTALLTLVPAALVFIFSQFFGCLMALKRNQLTDIILTLFFVILYAIPIYIFVPLIIEKIGLKYHLPIFGYHTLEKLEMMTSLEKFYDVFRHLLLPYLALIYGSLAIYSRLNKNVYLDVLRQEYILAAKAKGLSYSRIILVHVNRAALVSIAPLFLGGIGFFLSGAVIVENLFEIDGFGRFYYQAMINHDYNVIMFGTLIVAMLTLIGHFLSEMTLYLLDPRLRYHANKAAYFSS